MKDKTLKQLVESIKVSGQPKTSAYDTPATVTRIENGVAWVHIPGGVRETPVKLTINAQAGDTVQVRVSGGRAFMVGNATAPPTDDRVANKALGETKTITKVVKTVQKLAERTAKIAGNTNQYFWHTESGTDTGAHITEIPQEDFLADPDNGGGNLLARSNGVAVRDGLTELAQFTSNGVSFNDSTGAEVANFGAGGSTLGKSNKAHMEQTPTKTTWYGSDGTTEVLKLQTSLTGNSVLHLSGNRLISATTDTMVNAGVTTYDDNIDIRVIPVSGHDHSKIDLAAWGASLTEAATVRISDYEVYGTTVLVCPSKVNIDTDVTVTGNVDASGNVNAGAVTSFTPTWETGQEPAGYHCVVSAGLCSLFYQGPVATHATNTLIGTLPVGARPMATVFCPFVKAGSAYGTIRIEATGEIYVGFISSTTVNQRIYFNCSYPVV